MPKNRPGKRDRSKSAKKDVPAAQKSKTTTGAAIEEQIISPLGSIPLEQGPTTVDQQIGGESVGVNTSPEQGGGEVGVAQGVSSDLRGSKEVVSESTPPPPRTTDATEELIVAAGSKSTEDPPTTETTVGSLLPSDETNAPYDKTNAPIQLSTAATASKSTRKKLLCPSPPNQLKQHQLGPNALNVERRYHYDLHVSLLQIKVLQLFKRNCQLPWHKSTWTRSSGILTHRLMNHLMK